MIAQDAIGEKQINYSSFITGFNKDTNTNTIKSTKIMLNNQNQTLDVAFLVILLSTSDILFCSVETCPFIDVWFCSTVDTLKVTTSKFCSIALTLLFVSVIPASVVSKRLEKLLMLLSSSLVLVWK